MSLRYSFYSGSKIQVYERHRPSLLCSRMTVAQLENFFKVIARLDPRYVPQEFHKMWNILNQPGGNSELLLHALSEFQIFLREHRDYYDSEVLEKELGHWGDQEQSLFVAHYNTI